MKRKGAEMTIGTIIAITLGIAILVFLIFGFSTQWKSFQGVLDPLSGGDSNVDDITRGCEVACVSNNVNAYCTQIRTVRFGKDADGEKITDGVGSCEKLNADKNISVACNIC